MTKRNRNGTKAMKAMKTTAAKRAERPMELSTGFVVKVKPSSWDLLRAANAGIPEPKVPTVTDVDSGQEVPMYEDPAYLAEMAEYSRAQQAASMDATILFGVEILSSPDSIELEEVDIGFLNLVKMPIGDGWRRLIERFDPTTKDIVDPVDLYLLFVKLVVFSYAELHLLLASEETEADLDAAKASF